MRNRNVQDPRLRRILDVAVLEGNEVVILGAFGCGAFSNNPEVVAQAAKNVIVDYRHAFKVIVLKDDFYLEVIMT